MVSSYPKVIYAECICRVLESNQTSVCWSEDTYHRLVSHSFLVNLVLTFFPWFAQDHQFKCSITFSSHMSGLLNASSDLGTHPPKHNFPVGVAQVSYYYMLKVDHLKFENWGSPEVKLWIPYMFTQCFKKGNLQWSWSWWVGLPYGMDFCWFW